MLNFNAHRFAKSIYYLRANNCTRFVDDNARGTREKVARVAACDGPIRAIGAIGGASGAAASIVGDCGSPLARHKCIQWLTPVAVLTWNRVEARAGSRCRALPLKTARLIPRANSAKRLRLGAPIAPGRIGAASLWQSPGWGANSRLADKPSSSRARACLVHSSSPIGCREPSSPPVPRLRQSSRLGQYG
jgi:hypothetical protein